MQLLQVHDVVDAGEEQPAATAQVADQRMVERAGIGLVSRDRRRRGRHRAARLVQVGLQQLTAGVGRTRNAGTDHRRIVDRPLAARRHRARVGQPAPRGGGVGEGLRDVPVFLAAGLTQLLLGRGRQRRGQGIGDSLLLDQDAGGRARSGSAQDLAVMRGDRPAGRWRISSQT